MNWDSIITFIILFMIIFLIYSKIRDKSLRETGIREFREETGCNMKISVSANPIHIYTDSDYSFSTYIGLISEEFIPDLSGETKDELENLDFGWFKLDDFPGELMPQFRQMLKDKKNAIKKIIKKYE